MRPLLISLPAWLVALVAAPFIVQLVLQFEIPKKWRLPAAVLAVVVVAAVALVCRHSALPVHAYGVMLALAAVVAITIGVSRCELAGFRKPEIVDFGLYLVLCGVVGARVFHVFERHDLYITGPKARGFLDAIAVWNGGLVFYGGVMGSMCYAAWWALRRPPRAAHGGSQLLRGKAPESVRALVRLFDLAAPCVMYGLAMGRVGCFLNGCCYGGATKLACAVAYPQGSPLWRAVFEEPGSRASQWKELMPLEGMSTFHVHPQQIYASLIALALGTFLSWAFYKRWRLGTVSVLFLLTYSVNRFVLEGWLRGDTPRAFRALPFTISQYVSIAAFAAGIVWGAALLRAATPRPGGRSGGAAPSVKAA